MKTSKSVLVPLVLGICAGLLLFGCLFYYDSLRYRLSMAETQAAESRQDAIQIETEEVSCNNIKEEVTGYNVKRVQSDSSRIEEVLSDAFTWHTLKDYNAKRDMLKEKLSLADDSHFLKVFFPEVEIIKDQEGNEYNRIDTSGETLNLEYEDLSPTVIFIDDNDVYTYATRVTVSSSVDYEDSKHNHKVSVDTGYCLLLYKTNPDGSIFDVDAYILV